MSSEIRPAGSMKTREARTARCLTFLEKFDLLSRRGGGGPEGCEQTRLTCVTRSQPSPLALGSTGGTARNRSPKEPSRRSSQQQLVWLGFRES